MTDFRCVICDSVGQWENVDQYRFKKEGMHMCKMCGFVSYPDRCKKMKEMKERYREGEYRPAPTSGDLFTGERKLQYHLNFLDETFQKWKKENKALTVAEIGSGLGLFLNWMRQNFPNADINGTELDKSRIRTAFWLYQLKLKEEFDESKKYDLIMSYKVLEHMPDADLELEKYARCLSDDGLLYISVPCWFGRLNNHGLPGIDLEFYYSPDHVNVWSRNLFENLLAKCGFEIIKENHTMYDETYLCKKNDLKRTATRQIDDPTKRLEQMDKIFKAVKAMEQNKFAEAIALWPDCPAAHIGNYELNRGKAHQLGWEGLFREHIGKAVRDCPDAFFIYSFAADVCMRYEQWDAAISYYDAALKARPMDGASLLALAHALRNKALKAQNMADRIKLTRDAMGLCALVEKNCNQYRWEAVNWLMQDAATMPTPSEPGAEGLYATAEADRAA